MWPIKIPGKTDFKLKTIKITMHYHKAAALKNSTIRYKKSILSNIGKMTKLLNKTINFAWDKLPKYQKCNEIN